MRSHAEVRPAYAKASARSRHSSPRRHGASGGGRSALAMVAVLVAAMSVGQASVDQESTQEKATRPGQAEISRALEIVKADPNLATERTIKTLQWRESSTEPEPRATRSSLSGLDWIAGLFRWMDQSARYIVWVMVVALVGALVVRIVRMVGESGVSPGKAGFVAPTHVRDLDIRPESLPHDIGAASRALWDRGEHRAALALLYRGLLSRLAHKHEVPIRDSSTEGDCLALAEKHLSRRRSEYASRLVRVWQRFVYGGQDTETATVHVLCHDFASVLDAASSLDSMGSRRRG